MNAQQSLKLNAETEGTFNIQAVKQIIPPQIKTDFSQKGNGMNEKKINEKYNM